MAIVASSQYPVRAGSAPLSWQHWMKTAVRDPLELCRLLNLPARWETGALAAARQFPLFAPRPFIARMKLGDPGDPLLRQVLPLAEEANETEGFSEDPVQERDALAAPGLLQKYQGRALLVTTSVCAVHCRYCFRRHFPYSQTTEPAGLWQSALEALAVDNSLEEIILSGGDPLTLVDERLNDLVEQLAAIPHLRRLRLHTRLPIMIPSRITDQLLELLRRTRLTPIMVIHANHPAELDQDVLAALSRLVDTGIPVLNQAVLLRGINDDEQTLAQLCLSLVNHRVIPYYLHQLDRVAGAAHFEVPRERGLKLLDGLRARLPGYAVPRYVQEVGGEVSKIALY